MIMFFQAMPDRFCKDIDPEHRCLQPLQIFAMLYGHGFTESWSLEPGKWPQKINTSIIVNGALERNLISEDEIFEAARNLIYEFI